MGARAVFSISMAGPYEADDYIADAFPEATEEEHAEAIDRIDGEGPEFAPAGHRILHPKEDDDDRYLSPPQPYRLDALGQQLQNIKIHVIEILALQQREQSQKAGMPQMGQNHLPATRSVNQDFAITTGLTFSTLSVGIYHFRAVQPLPRPQPNPTLERSIHTLRADIYIF